MKVMKWICTFVAICIIIYLIRHWGKQDTDQRKITGSKPPVHLISGEREREREREREEKNTNVMIGSYPINSESSALCWFFNQLWGGGGVDSTQVFFFLFLFKNSLLDHTLRPTCKFLFLAIFYHEKNLKI